MKICCGWLREHLNVEITPQDLAKHLLILGFEVSGIQTLGPGFEGVVIGEILQVGKHPNADRLSLCQVKVGVETLSIVCGAKNVAVGARVPVARIGAKLPGGRAIERTKIRGTESQGMICSAPELGLSSQNGDGILILPPDTPVGADAARLLGETDHVLEVEITPNRPDCLSHFGLARELSIYFHAPLKPVVSGAAAGTGSPDAQLENAPSRPVTIEAKDACGRYLGRDFAGLRVGPSPGWLARRLEAIGLRPINNAVDITNYVLFELGHPLHAFDADKLQGDKIVVRRAKSGEKLKALDGKEYPLTGADLVIADASGPTAVAGVIGGEPTGVTEKTARVFLEAAHFDPGTVRRTSRRLGIRTDSSYRFERGADIEAAQAAAARAATLLLKLCGGKASLPVDVYQKRPERAPIAISAARVNQILGASYPPDRIETVLKNIATRIAPSDAGMMFFPPSHRSDLATPWDLAEEAARHLGYDRIPDEAGPVKLQRPKSLPLVDMIQALRRRMQAEGFFEAYNMDFVSEAQLKLLESSELRKPVRILNPLSEDQAYLRPTLLLNLLQNAVYNQSRGADGIRLFEIGRVYELNDQREPVERTCMAGIQLGKFPQDSHWQAGPDKEKDLPAHFFIVKGIVEDILNSYPQIERAPHRSSALFHPGASTALTVSGARLGAYGMLHPSIERQLDLKEPVAMFVLDLDRLSEIPVPTLSYAPFSAFPSVVRDLSIVLAESVPYSKVLAALKGVNGLMRVALVDVYAGKGITSGMRSLTLRLTFSSPERTLRDVEIQAAVQIALDRLAKDCGAKLRS